MPGTARASEGERAIGADARGLNGRSAVRIVGVTALALLREELASVLHARARDS